MKKESNVMPVDAVRPDAPKTPPAFGVTHQRIAIIFNEWAKRYSERPDEFSNILDDDGNPVSDYGDCCAIYFNELKAELDRAGVLPKPTTTD